jgi:hypothetical protein
MNESTISTAIKRAISLANSTNIHHNVVMRSCSTCLRCKFTIHTFSIEHIEDDICFILSLPYGSI